MTNAHVTLGSPLIDGIFLIQKMCIYSCVALSTTLLMRAVRFNARSACDASMFTSGLHQWFASELFTYSSMWFAPVNSNTTGTITWPPSLKPN